MTDAGVALATAGAEASNGAPLVLCDLATQALSLSRLEFVELSPFVAKGVAEPMRVFRAIAARESATLTNANAFGREREQAAIERALDQLCARGAGSTLVIEGEPGMGKSMVLASALEHAKARGVRVLVGAASDIERSTPYFVFRRVFAELCGVGSAPSEPAAALADAPSSPSLKERLQELLRPFPDLLELAPLLGPVLGLSFPETVLTRSFEGEVRADNTRKVLMALLREAAQSGRLMLILEDAQWFDSASWALTRLVSLEGWAVTLISTRPVTDEPFKEAAQIRALPSTTWCLLEGIDLASTTLLIQDRLAVRSVPQELVRTVHQRGGGNPFFMDQIVGVLSQGTALQIEDGVCRLSPGTDLEAFELPDTVEGVVSARLDKLSAAEQLTLRVASVIGRTFEVSALHHIHPLDADRALVAVCLETLARLEITLPEARASANASYLFRHIILHEVAYRQLLSAQRRELHLALASWYERHLAADLAPHHGLLAWHFERAESHAQTLHHLEKAGESALRENANREAIGFFSRALRLAQRPELPIEARSPLTLATWERKLGDAWYGLGQLPAAAAHLETALEHLGRPRPRNIAWLLLCLLWQVLVQAAHRFFPRLFRPHGDSARFEAARAYQRLGEIAYFQSDTNFLAYSTVASANFAETAAPSFELVRALSTMSVTAAVVPLHWLARYYSRAATETARALGEPGALAYALTLKALNLYGLGQVQTAREALLEAAEIAQRRGDLRRYEETQSLLAHVHLLEGDFEQALRAFAGVHALAKKQDDAQPQIWGLVGQFVSALTLGKHAGYAEGPDEAERMIAKNAVRGDIIYAAGVASVARRARGDWAGARVAAERALELMQKSMPTTVYALEGYAGTVETLVALYDASGPRVEERDPNLGRLARRACRQFFRFATPFAIARPRFWIFYGAYQSSRGNEKRARWAANKGLEQAQQRGIAYDEARANALLATLSEAGGEARAAHDGRARDIATALGAASEWARFLDLGKGAASKGAT